MGEEVLLFIGLGAIDIKSKKELVMGKSGPCGFNVNETAPEACRPRAQKPKNMAARTEKVERRLDEAGCDELHVRFNNGHPHYRWELRSGRHTEYEIGSKCRIEPF